MFNFDLKETAIFQAVKLEKIFGFFEFLKKLFLSLFILTFLIFLYGFVPENFSPKMSSVFLGLSVIFLTLYLSFKIKKLFFNLKLKKPKIRATIKDAVEKPKEYNLAEFLSFESARAVYKSLKFAKSKKFSKVNSSILFYFILIDNPDLNFVFLRNTLNLDKIKKTLEFHFKKSKDKEYSRSEGRGLVKYSNDFQDIIFESFKIAEKKNHQRVEVTDLIAAMAKHNLIFKNMLIKNKLKIEDIENSVCWLETLKEEIIKEKKFWEYENLAKKGTLAKHWTAGYTIMLDKYSIDWTEILKKKGFEKIIGHQQQIEEVERILARSETNNVLLVGEAGTGRGSIIQSIAQRSLFGRNIPSLNYKRVVELDLVSLLAEIESPEEAEQILDRIFQEVLWAGNIILILNEFHNFTREIIKPGVIDITGVLPYYLKLPQFQIIAVTNFSGFHKFIEPHPSISAFFTKVEVSEISQEETLYLLEKFALIFENKHKKIITCPALREIIRYADRYLSAIPFPAKAINLLDETVIYTACSTKSLFVLPKHAAKVILEKTQIPVGEIEIKEKEILLNLENLIHQRLINQDEAVKEISSALRRIRSEITIRKGPMGAFLFLGPTGVGKTETSKVLAKIYFGSESRMIRLDMSEFQNTNDIPRLIGSSEEEGILTTKVRENPFSLILLDEFEKAHPNILNLFLQVFDEGHLTDGLGRKTDFRSAIIIATSNAGYKVILEAIKKSFKEPEVKQKLLDFLFKESIFRPELINRFDAMVVFRSLDKQNLLKIAQLMLEKLRENLKVKDIEFIITLSLKEKIVELGYNPIFGAREMKRVIQDKVENVLASALLSNQLKGGDKVMMDAEDFRLIIS